MRRREFIAAIALPLAACAPMAPPTAAAAPATYAATMRQLLQSSAGDLPGYQFRGTPIGNFGVGTIYLDDVSDLRLTRVESAWYLGGPDTWLVGSASATERRRWMDRLVGEGSLGALNVDSSASRAAHATLGTALLATIVGHAGIDYAKGVTFSVRADEALNRRLNWAEFNAALGAGRIAPEVADVVRRGKFVIVAADVVLIGFRTEIKVDETQNAALAASLRSNVLLPQLRATDAGFDLREGAQGSFVAEATTPVVAAMLFKRPPAQSKVIGERATLPAIDAWPAATVDDQTLQAIEARLRPARKP